ncbi:MAG: hypothetical protein KDB88_01715 [Flavobacteriales bacterium]|nr:hypothetical protein [Flavobacteriales bacterium]
MMLPASGAAQLADTVTFTALGQYQFPYSLGSISSSAFSCRIDRLDRPFVYVCCRELGLVTFSIADPLAPVPIDTIPAAALGGLAVNNVEQLGDLLYVSVGGFEDGQQEAGLATVSVSDPSAPVILDLWSDPAFLNGAAICAVKDSLAFLGAMDDGVIVLNVSDPGAIMFVSSFQPDTVWPGIVNYPPQARGMAIKDDVLFLCYDAGAFRALSISDPYQLAQLGQYINPMHPNFTAIAHNNVTLVGDHAIVAYDFCGFEVIDVSDPGDMQQVSWVDPWNCFGLSWFGSDGHTNELVTASGDSILLISAADSELLAYRIDDLASPSLIGSYGPPNDSAATWGFDRHGDLIVLCYLNNSFIPIPQPFHSNYGGIRLLSWSQDLGITIADRLSIDALRLFPNPVHAHVTIEVQGSDAPYTVDLIDGQGRTVLRSTSVARNGAIGIDVSALEVGWYTALVQHQEAFLRSPLLVVH